MRSAVGWRCAILGTVNGVWWRNAKVTGAIERFEYLWIAIIACASERYDTLKSDVAMEDATRVKHLMSCDVGAYQREFTFRTRGLTVESITTYIPFNAVSNMSPIWDVKG